MPNLITFITAIAWIFGIWNTISAMIQIFLNVTYDWREQLKDLSRYGRTRYWPWKGRVVIATLCWTWIITQ